ncbi:hypothetical protein ABHD31_09850 [Enterobacter cloacae]|uniref:hypothetical protein n=1 Tax=Enterobacter cloacae TaxID=550 RepID=UPI00325BA652
MEKVITIIAAVTGLAFWVGLISPKLVLMPNRKRSSAVYLVICLAAGIVGSVLYPTQKTAAIAQEKKPEPEKVYKFATQTLKDWRLSTQAKRHEWIDNYAEFAGLTKAAAGDFYSCVSEYSYTKSEGLQLGMVLSWCKTDYDNDPGSLSKRINFDTFEDQFSHWNGTYKPLEARIKETMHDDSSYKHVETTYRLLLKDTPHAIVSTTFRGSNVYGAIVKQTISADVDIKTGQIIKIVE